MYEPWKGVYLWARISCIILFSIYFFLSGLPSISRLAFCWFSFRMILEWQTNWSGNPAGFRNSCFVWRGAGHPRAFKKLSGTPSLEWLSWFQARLLEINGVIDIVLLVWFMWHFKWRRPRDLVLNDTGGSSSDSEDPASGSSSDKRLQRRPEGTIEAHRLQRR